MFPCLQSKHYKLNSQGEGKTISEAFINFWSGINDEDDIINSEENLDINIEDVVEQEVNKTRKQERYKEEMRLLNF